MKSKINILFIAFLLVFASSCAKYAPLERVVDTEKGVDNSNDNVILKSATMGGTNDDTSGPSITDPEHDEDFDADGNITDTDTDEDYDKEGEETTDSVN